jgi:putative restriction endonuclease
MRELLIASHILPWRSHEKERLNVRNGICLNRLHDAAFDGHLIGFDRNLQLVLSPQLKALLPQEAISHQFESYEGTSLNLPEHGIPPEDTFLEAHRKKLKV